MPDIDITDYATAGADATPAPSTTTKIDDTSLLAKLGLKKLVFQARDLVTEFGKPVSQAAFTEFDVDASFHLPNLAAGATPAASDEDGPALKISPGTTAKLAIKTNGDLFDGKDASPAIAIEPGEAWIAFTLGAGLNVDAEATVESVGLKVEADAEVSFTTYTKVAGNMLLKEACTTALKNFDAIYSSAKLKSIPVGLVYETEAKGSVTTSVTFQQGFDINAFASVTLPVVKTDFTVKPDVSVGLTGSVEIEGDLVVRAYKPDAGHLVLGVYTEHADTLKASLTAVAGIDGNVGDTDVFGKLLELGLPVNPDPTNASKDEPFKDARYNIPQDQKDAINAVIKDTLSQSLAVQVAAVASTTRKYETAVLFNVDLSANPTDLDNALGKALRGDWRDLPKVGRLVNDVTANTQEKKLSLSFNFLGLYSASSVTTYLKTCKITRDNESNQLTIGDTVKGSRTDLQVLTTAPDAKQLRRALMLDFLSTVTYAVVDGHVAANMSATHTYLDYGVSMSEEDRYRNVQLGYALGAQPGSLDAMLNAATGTQACARARVQYSKEGALRFFFSDPVNFVPYDFSYVEDIGRRMLARVIVHNSENRDRIAFLNNANAWKEAEDEGESYLSMNTAYFNLNSATLPFLLSDYRAVRFWSNAVVAVAPVLADVLKMLGGISGDPTQNKDFMKKRGKLTDKLEDVANTLGGSFEPTWGEAVMYALAQEHGNVEVDLAWGGEQHSYTNGQ